MREFALTYVMSLMIYMNYVADFRCTLRMLSSLVVSGRRHMWIGDKRRVSLRALICNVVRP